MRAVFFAALAAFFAFPALAEEPMEECANHDNVRVCVQLEPTCEPAAKYDGSWEVFRQRHGYASPVSNGTNVHPTLGLVNFVGFEAPGGKQLDVYGVAHGSVDVCLIVIAYKLDPGA